jgi:hypothetical protein
MVSKPIRTTYYKWWNNPEKQLLLPGGVFHNQGLFYAKHLHHSKAYGIDATLDYGYVSHGRFFHCNKLVILRELWNHPEHIWIDKPSQLYLEAIKNNRKHCYNCNDLYGPKGRHQCNPGYNSKTILPFKKNSNVANHRVGSVQFGDLTFIQSSNRDL